MKLRINIIDAFTEMRFKGNSAAVIISEEWPPCGRIVVPPLI